MCRRCNVTINITECYSQLQATLDKYGKASGAKINIQKSKAMAVGMWDTTVNKMGIQHRANVKIFGIHFANTTSQSALKRWSVVTDGLRAQAREASYRELSLNKRSHFAHTYILARAWFTAQIFPIPLTCERQINTAVTCFLWKGSIFRLPLSTIQRRKLQGGWDLINVGAKSQALLHFRIKIQSTATGSLTADLLRKWHLQTPGHKPAPDPTDTS